MTNGSHSPILPLLEEVRQELERLQRALDGGTLEETLGLTSRMETLMQGLQALPREEAGVHLPALQSLYEGMATLEEGCVRHAETIQKTLHQFPTLVRASTAYAKQGATTGKREE